MLHLDHSRELICEHEVGILNLNEHDGTFISIPPQPGPILGAHTHAHAHAHLYPWVLGGHGYDVIVHG